jgi:hypothetical protein
MVPSERRHAFASPLTELPGIGGSCRSCGASDLVDWERLHRRDPTDLANVTFELRKELIRDNYWHEPLPARILRNALKRTPDQLAQSAGSTLRRALVVGHARERGQTYFAYNDKATIIHCAQHATATCCRTCLEIWQGIPLTQPLGPENLAYCTALVDGYITTRLAQPELVLAEAA